MSVLGFEDARSDRYMYPAISCIAHPDARLVECTLDVLWGTGGEPARRLLITPTLVVRESTAEAPEDGTDDLGDVSHNDPQTAQELAAEAIPAT